MMWSVVTVEVFDAWFMSLDEAEQVDILAHIRVLELMGPALGRPYVDTLKASTLPNLKELRIQHRGKPYRVLFIFDPQRQAVLLCGGDKTGDKRFYKRMIPLAEREFAHYLGNGV